MEHGLGQDPDNYEKVVSGTIFYGCGEDGPEIIKGNIYIENGIICDIEETAVPLSNWIVPRFVNAHTHIGDSVLKDPPLSVEDSDGSSVSGKAGASLRSGPSGASLRSGISGASAGYRRSCVIRKDLDYLVRPPDGLKHRILAETPSEELISAMIGSINEMYHTGTGLFADFREGGLEGIRQLMAAYECCHGDICPVIFGRPDGLYDPDNGDGSRTAAILSSLRGVLDSSSGIGLSGAADLDEYTLSKIADRTHLKKKILAVHAGEKTADDIRPALDLDPDLLIHMTHASGADIDEIAQKHIPVIVCPGSNFVTGSGRPPIAEMIDEGVTVGVGTDNVMLNSPDMFSEMRLLSKVFSLSDKTVYRMCTQNGAKALRCGFTGSIDIGLKADLMVLNADSLNLSNVSDPLSGFVRRARAEDIIGIL